MSLLAGLAAAILLQPVLADDGDLRLVAVGTGGDDVTWSLDGRVVARTRDGEAARVDASAGPHELWASSASEGRWRALARPDGRPSGGAEVVPAWTAENEPAAAPARPTWLLPAGAAVGSAAVLVRPRSLLQALRRARRP